MAERGGLLATLVIPENEFSFLSSPLSTLSSLLPGDYSLSHGITKSLNDFVIPYGGASKLLNNNVSDILFTAPNAFESELSSHLTL